MKAANLDTLTVVVASILGRANVASGVRLFATSHHLGRRRHCGRLRRHRPRHRHLGATVGQARSSTLRAASARFCAATPDAGLRVHLPSSQKPCVWRRRLRRFASQPLRMCATSSPSIPSCWPVARKTRRCGCSRSLLGERALALFHRLIKHISSRLSPAPLRLSRRHSPT